jgi:RNA polymerase primary sigma factor
MESSIDSDLFSSNVRLVYALAKRYSSNEVDHEDVVQDGKLGLFLATKTFEENKGVAFSTWANYWIKAFILRGQVKFT